MTRKLARNPDLPYQKVLEEVLIVAPRDRRLHRLNEVASYIWMSLDRPRTADELARLVSREFDIDEKTARKDVKAFVSELKKKDLLE